MKIKCLHGYFKFEETYVGEVSAFMRLFNAPPIVRKDDYFTFEDLLQTPGYSLKGGTYLGALASSTVEGTPWDIMRANKLVYNFLLAKVVPIATITQGADFKDVGPHYTSPGLLLPGSLLSNGSRVTDYVGWFTAAKSTFNYSQIGVE